MSHLTKILVLVPSLLIMLEFNYLSDIDDLSIYQFFRWRFVKLNGKSEIIPSIGNLINFILAVVLQIRMELDNLTHNESYGCLHAIKQLLPSQTDTDDNGSNVEQLKVVRRVFLVCILFAVVIIYHRTIGRENLQNTFAAFGFLIHSSIPAMYVYNHNAMRGIATSLIQQWLPEPFMSPIV